MLGQVHNTKRKLRQGHEVKTTVRYLRAHGTAQMAGDRYAYRGLYLLYVGDFVQWDEESTFALQEFCLSETTGVSMVTGVMELLYFMYKSNISRNQYMDPRLLWTSVLFCCLSGS